jgi:hypothetical protein
MRVVFPHPPLQLAKARQDLMGIWIGRAELVLLQI